MNNYANHNFTPEALETFQGYSLQAFASGRIKLSFHRTHIHRDEYYAERPKRDAEAYHRQRRRSAEALPNHFALVDTLRTDRACGATLRVHLKGDNNKTADNAHVLLSWSICCGAEAMIVNVSFNSLFYGWLLYRYEDAR